jgi:hypothetical protein
VLLVARFCRATVTLLVVGHRCLDRVFRKDRAVDLDRRQREFFGDVRVLDFRNGPEPCRYKP